MIILTLVVKKFLFKKKKKARMWVGMNCLQPLQCRHSTFFMDRNLQVPVSSPKPGGDGFIRKIGYVPMGTAYFARIKQNQEDSTQVLFPHSYLYI